MTRLARKYVERVQEPDEAVEAAAVLGKVLAFPTLQAESLSEQHDLLRLLGAVVAQKVLLEVAVGAHAAKDRATAAKALMRLRESPELIAERLKASPFAGVSTKDLLGVVDAITKGQDVKSALLAVTTKEA